MQVKKVAKCGHPAHNGGIYCTDTKCANQSRILHLERAAAALHENALLHAQLAAGLETAERKHEEAWEWVHVAQEMVVELEAANKRCEGLLRALTERNCEVRELELTRDVLDDQLNALSKKYVRLRKATEIAASAPGRDWLAEQLALGKVLSELDEEAAETTG